MNYWNNLKHSAHTHRHTHIYIYAYLHRDMANEIANIISWYVIKYHLTLCTVHCVAYECLCLFLRLQMLLESLFSASSAHFIMALCIDFWAFVSLSTRVQNLIFAQSAIVLFILQFSYLVFFHVRFVASFEHNFLYFSVHFAPKKGEQMVKSLLSRRTI